MALESLNKLPVKKPTEKYYNVACHLMGSSKY